MGIPKLIQTLQPYAERVVLGYSDSITQPSSDTSSENASDEPPIVRVRSVIIDGPSLVYHVYHCLLSHKASQLYHLKSANTSSTSDYSHNPPLLVQPTYKEINQAVLSFITHLESDHNVEIRTIYFDGGLPISKRNVRQARLEDIRRKLVKFRNLHSDLVFQGEKIGRDAHDASEETYESGNQDVAGHLLLEALFHPPAPLPVTFKSIPAPAFMVAAVIEHLQSHFILPRSTSNLASTTSSSALLASHTHHRFPIIQIVPGEADTYCAANARKTGAAILTSDSDLLAYDLGTEASVILLNSVELSKISSSAGDRGRGRLVQLLGTRYHGPSLTSKLGLPPDCSLQGFCFYRSCDASVGTLKLKLRCCGIGDMQRGVGGYGLQEEQEEWRRFLRQYSSDGIAFQDGDEDVEENDVETQDGKTWSENLRQRFGRSYLHSHLQGLDPRVAELVMQFQNQQDTRSDGPLKEDEGVNGDDQENLLHMYLPFLLEDPSRDSAWSYGRSLRLLAYSVLLRLYAPCPIIGKNFHHAKLQEFQRRGARIVGLCVDIDAGTSCLLQIDAVIQTLQRTFKSQKQLSTSSRWKSFALSCISEQRISDGRSPPDSRWAERFLTLQQGLYEPTAWDDVHNQASVEAVLYSLRMLKQVTTFVLGVSFQRGRGEGKDDQRSLKELIDALDGLPRIEEVMGLGWVEKVNARRSKTGNESKDGGVEAEVQNRESESNTYLLSPVDDPSKDLLRRTTKRQRLNTEAKSTRRQKETVQKQMAQAHTRDTGNMFAVLGLDE